MAPKGTARLLPFLMALLLAAALVPASVAAADGEDGAESSGKGKRDRDTERGGNDRENRGRDDQERPQLGEFKHGGPGKAASGEFVSFLPTGRGITNFTVDGVPLWNAIVVPADQAARAPKVENKGVQTEVEATDGSFEFKAHDIPTAEAKFKARQFRITFPENVTVDESPRGVVVHAGDVTGVLFGGGLEVDGRVVTGEGTVHFLARGPGSPGGPARESLDAAKIAGRVGAEVVVRHEPGAPSALKDAVVSYGNVTVQTLPEDGGVTFVVDGNPGDARVLILNVDAALVRNSTLQELAFRFDNETLRPADSLADVLNPDDDGLVPEFFVVSDLTGTYQVIVSVPHYSVHTITVQSLAGLVPPSVSVTIGLLAASAFLVLAAVTLFRRPKQ